jgi:hypothetical protein
MRLTVPQFGQELIAHDLNFQPRVIADRWTPTFAWGQLLLTNFKSPSDHVIDLKLVTPDFYSAFVFCYPKINLLELLRITNCFKKLNATDIAKSSDAFVTNLLSKYGYNVRAEYFKILSLLEVLPADFLSWVEEKELWFNDLSILLEIANPNDSLPKEVLTVLSWIVSSRSSKSQGTQILELVCELHLRGEDAGFIENIFGSIELPKNIATKEIAIEQLRALRFKRTVSMDLQKSTLLKKMNWPNGVSTQLLRNGDRSAIQIQLNLQNKKDLEAQLKAISERTDSLKDIL